ncbi:MAG: type II toxin-antitoxin system RelE/ParE family toxin [Acidithiobacillus sp.]|nr:type II toxin-antitoxin system RelE/ParE family toxin [Acidithiobacillus sp.]
MELYWSTDAIQDRETIYDYVEAHNPAAAQALDELFEERAGQLAYYPNLGHPGRVLGTRELVVHQNYILVYDESHDLLRVLRVLHAARQWP